MATDERWAQALGWFSIGIGLTEVLAPRQLANTIGINDSDDNCTVLRGFGVREIVNGIGILTQPRSSGWLWGRVGGDAMDLAFLCKQYGDDATDKGRLSTAVAAVVGVAALDVMCGEQVRQQQSDGITAYALSTGKVTRQTITPKRKDGAMDLKQAVTINRSAQELYAYWRDFQNLPRFMNHLEAVQVTGATQSHWKAKAPLGQTVEWDAEITNDQPGKLIGWRSVPGSGIENWGNVEFMPSTDGAETVVRVELHYSPPGGAIGSAIAKLFGEEPEQQVWEDLHRFKQIMELGEITLSDGSPGGMVSAMHAGQPLKPGEPIKD